MTDWNSDIYLKYESERTRPASDLASFISVLSPHNIIDIGCGPGNSTAVLASVFPEADIVGVDNSSDMLNKACALHPELSFSKLDISSDISRLNSSFDLVFSNACIQWLPNHTILLPKLMDLLTPGGVLAVQIPLNFDEPIHRIIRRITTSSYWADKFDSHRTVTVLTYSEYYNILSELSSDFNIWQTTYYHRMPSVEAILDWYRATGLRTYLAQLCDDDRSLFENELLHALRNEYKVEPCGEVIFPFPRLFFTARR